jgi:aspartate aminotransferase
MTWWRLWVAIWPEDVIEKMSLLLQTTSSCVSPFLQYAGIEAITWDQSKVYTMVKEYKERRDLLVDWLNTIKWISCIQPGWAFYVFPNIKATWMTSEEFTDFALEKAKIAILPWSNFWEYGEWYVRLCYATSKEKIIEWIKRLKKALE